MSPVGDRPPFDAVEDAETSGMRAGRAIEFRAGRWLAREALAGVGAPPGRILRGESRRPAWPTGYTGSISHTGLAVIAVAAKCSTYRSVGIDLELRGSLDEALIDQVFTAQEIEVLDTLPGAMRPDFPTLVFSAKEAAYKCQHPITERLVDFQDCETTFDLDERTFEAAFSSPVDQPNAPLVIAGRWTLVQGHVLTVSWLPAT